MLGKLFRYHGFEAEQVEEDQGLTLLRVRQGSLTVEVLPMVDAPEMDERELLGLLDRRTSPDRRLVASLGTFTAGARELAERRGAQLWDRSRIEAELGRALLAEEDTRRAPAGESLLEDFLKGGPGPVREAAGAGGEAPGPPLADLPGEMVVAPRLGLEQARSSTPERLEGAFRFDLQYFPHYLFSYECGIDGEAPGRARREGAVLIDAITGEPSEWPSGERLELMGDGTRRTEPSLDRSSASRNALEKVVELNTRVVNLKREKGAVTVYEKRTFKPNPEAVRLELRGMVYLPFWCVEGSNGAVVMDALFGKVRKEEYFHRPAVRTENGSQGG